MHDPSPTQTPLAGVSLGEWIRALRAARFRVRAGSRLLPAKARLKDFIRHTLRIEYRRWCRIVAGEAQPDKRLVARLDQIHSEQFRDPIRIVGRVGALAWNIETKGYYERYSRTHSA